MDQLPVVTLTPDYGTPSPLWADSPDTLDLVPEALTARLIAWEQDFEANFRWDTGWQSYNAKRAWAAMATDLEAELRAALAGKAEVVVDLWPLRYEKPGQGTLLTYEVVARSLWSYAILAAVAGVLALIAWQTSGALRLICAVIGGVAFVVAAWSAVFMIMMGRVLRVIKRFNGPNGP